MKRQEGSIFKLPLNGNQWVYGRVTSPNGGILVYDKLCHTDLTKQEILQLPILFPTSVFKYAFSKKYNWLMVHHEPLTEAEKEIPPMYTQDKVPPFNCKIFINGGVDVIRNVPYTQCIGLQPAVVWEPELMVERIKFYYSGEKSVWVEHLKLFNPETGEKTNWPPF